MKTFDDFWTALTSNEIWFENMKVKHARKNLKVVAENCYHRLLTQPERLKAWDAGDFQRAFMNACTWEKDEPIKPYVPSLQETKQEDHGPPPLEGEARAEWIRKWQAQNQAAPLLKPARKMSTREADEQGGVRPPKTPAYKSPLTEREILLKEAIATVRVETYGLNTSIDGFQLHRIGLMEVFAKSDTDARIILNEATERVEKYLASKT